MQGYAYWYIVVAICISFSVSISFGGRICIKKINITVWTRVATNLENLEYSGISLNTENSWNSSGILWNHRENWLCTLSAACVKAVHTQPSVSGSRRLLIWAMWDDRFLLVTWVVVDVGWPLIYEGHYYVYFFYCSNLWKSVIMALESLENSANFFFYFVATLLNWMERDAAECINISISQLHC